MVSLEIFGRKSRLNATLLIWGGCWILSPILAKQDSTVFAQSSDETLKQQVEILVQRLDANQLARRQEAERELAELGVEILSLLPEDDSQFSSEARQRLRRVRQELEQQRASEAAMPRVIRFKNPRTLADAFGQIQRDGGVEIEFPPGVADRPIPQSLVPLPFWAALDKVLDVADLDINLYAGELGQIVIMPRSEGRASRAEGGAYVGVYRMESIAVLSRRDLRNPMLNGMTIAAEIAWEPRLTPIGLTIPLKSLVAELDNGETLRAEEGEIEISTNPSVPFSQMNFPLPLPAGSAEKISNLSGTVISLLPGAKEHFKVPLDTRHEGENVGDVMFLVDDVRKNGELYEIRVEVVLEGAMNALESHRGWIFENPAYVIDENGKRIEHLGYQTYQQAADRVGISYLFDLAEKLEGKMFHYETPISVVSKEETFLMRDIELP